MKRILLCIFMSLFLFHLPGAAEEVQKVEVTAKVANIRSAPSLESQVIGKGFQGDVFVLLGSEGSWLKIELPADKEGVQKEGYIYKAITKIIVIKKSSKEPPPPEVKKEKKAVDEEKTSEEETEKTEKEKLKAEKKAEREKKKAEKKKLKAEKKAEKEKLKSMSKEEKEKLKAEKKAEREKKRAERKAEREKKKAEKKRLKAQKEKEAPKVMKKTKGIVDYLFKGFYLKGGWMTKPSVDSLGDKWVADLGFDSPIGKYATWGLEFQPYFRSFSADSIDFTAYNLVTNIFLNVKGGISPGLLWDKLDFITVFLGAGPGVSLGYLYTDFEGVTGSQFDVMFAWHIVYGAEFRLGKMNIVVEFQSNKVINTDVDPSTQSANYFLIGLRF
ncbi:MAG: SH3 domain-containing protein [Acidobacteriota bacterium]